MEGERITRNDILAAAAYLERRYARIYDQYLTLYRDTGERDWDRLAEKLGLDSYKEIIDAIEQHRAPRERAVREQITTRGLSRCYIGFGFTRHPDADNGWMLRYKAVIDLERNGVRYVLRGAGRTEPEADRDVIAQLDRFDLRRQSDEVPTGFYRLSEYDLPRDWGACEQWAVFSLLSGRWLFDELDQLGAQAVQPRTGGARFLNLGTDLLGDEIDRVTGTGLRVLERPDPARRWERELIRLPQGASLPAGDLMADPDTVAVRLLAMASPCSHGGFVEINGERVRLRRGSAVIFRPDLHQLRISPVLGGEQLMFSMTVFVPRNG